MLTRTFCHLPGIGPAREQALWDQGIATWELALDKLASPVEKNKALYAGLKESMDRLSRGDAGYFAALLPPKLHYRLFRSFRQKAVYLDIETTGLSPWDEVTTIALYDGKEIRWYVQGENMKDFIRDMNAYDLIITFNGKTFDLPFLRSRLNCALDQAHIDLRYVLAGLGFKGGLKKCEKAMGIHRGDLDGVDGSFAVVLWHEYQRTQNPKALETLLAYNIEDVVNLEILMVQAHNMMAEKIGLSETLPEPGTVDIPFSPDLNLIDRLRPKTFL